VHSLLDAQDVVHSRANGGRSHGRGGVGFDDNGAQPVYEDFFATKGAWKAGAAETTVRFFLDKGKLVVKGESQQFDVDPNTLKKTRTNDPVL